MDFDVGEFVICPLEKFVDDHDDVENFGKGLAQGSPQSR